MLHSLQTKNKIQSLTNLFLLLNLLLPWKSREEKNLSSRHPSCFCHWSSIEAALLLIIFQTGLIWLPFLFKVRARRGEIIQPVLKPISGSQHLICYKPLLFPVPYTLSPVALLYTLSELCLLLWPTSASHSCIWALWSIWQISQAVGVPTVWWFAEVGHHQNLSSELESQMSSVVVLSVNRKPLFFNSRIWVETWSNILSSDS